MQWIFGLLVVASAIGCGESHTGGPDAGGGLDAPSAADAGPDAPPLTSDAGTDAPVPVSDAGPACTPTEPGWCPTGVSCLSCPTGPIGVAYLCTTECASDGDCTDAARPLCNRDTMVTGSTGICTDADTICRWGVRCASPDTAIATPSGERRIADLIEGDLVYSADHGSLVPVPLMLVSHTPVLDHRVVRVTLESGRVLEISPGHPTADGRFFSDLRAGDVLDGIAITSAELVPYGHAFTYDILPASETGTYVAGGALIGSTLGP